jgi:hypothetical protein
LQPKRFACCVHLATLEAAARAFAVDTDKITHTDAKAGNKGTDDSRYDVKGL